MLPYQLHTRVYTRQVQLYLPPPQEEPQQEHEHEQEEEEEEEEKEEEEQQQQNQIPEHNQNNRLVQARLQDTWYA